MQMPGGQCPLSKIIELDDMEWKVAEIGTDSVEDINIVVVLVQSLDVSLIELHLVIFGHEDDGRASAVNGRGQRGFEVPDARVYRDIQMHHPVAQVRETLP